MSKRKGILYGAAILTASSIMTRLVGLVFRVFLSNKIGAEGMGLFQLIFSFYSLAIVFASSGINTAVSRLVAEQFALGNKGKVKKVMATSIKTSIVLSLFVGTIVFIFSDPISVYFLKDTRASISLKAFAPSLLFIAVSSCIKGYFYAANDVAKPASSEFVEQAVRMGFIGLALGIFIPKGIEYACAATLLGFTVGELASLLYLYGFYRFAARKKLQCKASKEGALGKLLSISVPIAFSSYTTSILRMEENILILGGLQKFGGTYTEAISTYGILSGMVMPTIMFPVSLLTSLAIIILPEVSKANVTHNNKAISDTVAKVLQFTTLLSVLIVGVFVTFPYELGTAIYNTSEVGSMLRMLSMICPFIYLEVVVVGILNALGEQMSSMRYNIADSLLRLLLIYIFVPQYGFTAFLWTMVFSNVFTSFLCLRRLSKVTQMRFDFVNWILKPGIAVAASALNVRVLFYVCLLPRLSLSVALIISIIITVVVYFFMNYLVGTFSSQDIKFLKKSFKKQNSMPSSLG